MAIVFWEGHLLLFVRYMVIIFQSIKRLYLAQLAACTKVKESDSPPSLWSQRILMCRCSGRMAEGPRKELRGSERGRYSFPCVLSPGSLWSISIERKHSYTLHQSLPVSSRLNLPWPSAVPLCFWSAVTPLQQWSAFCPGSSQREASVLFCMELQYVQMLQAQNPEQSKNVSCTQGTEIHKNSVYHKLHRDAYILSHQKLSTFICSQFCCFEQHPWPNIKRQQHRKK